MRNLRFEYIVIMLSGLFTWSCGDDGLTPGEWSIPEDRVLSGGVPRDGIPAIDNPQFIQVNEVSTLDDADLVVGFKNGDDIRAYPHEVLDWHEIVNDDVGGSKMALTYCPLTGTAIGWNRVIDGSETTFGVSGLLFNTNLMPYDRNTGSVWSQMLTSGVQGENINRPAELMQIIEMPWGEWKKLYPNSAVLSRNTGFPRSYGRYPYDNYRQTNNLFFPVDTVDTRLFGKERVLGVIIDNQAKIFRFESMNADGSVTVLKDSFQGRDIIVIGNGQVMTAFQVHLVSQSTDQVKNNQTPTDFFPLNNEFPAFFKDNLENKYDLFGEVIDGPDHGQRLEGLESYMGFFFSFPAFYPSPEIYDFE